jgi:hypothetical protein
MDKTKILDSSLLLATLQTFSSFSVGSCPALHKVKEITHLMIGLENWTETADVKGALKEAKAQVQQALMPGQVKGGTQEENVGVAYEFPDAKVFRK